jgi:hypothetical protein
MLKFLALKRLVILNRTPGLFSTRAEIIYQVLSSRFDIFKDDEAAAAVAGAGVVVMI